MRKFLSASVVCLAMAMPFSPAFAATVEAARSFVDGVSKQTLDIISDGKLGKQQKQAKLEKLFVNTVDIPWVGKFVLGQYWREATTEQRNKYLKEYGSFLTSHYAGRFAEYSGGSYKITDAAPGEEGYTVDMEIVTPDGTRVAVEYHVHEAGGKLRLFDVVVEGVSMITTQRSEFASVIGNSGLDYLIERLASKTLSIGESDKASKAN